MIDIIIVDDDIEAAKALKRNINGEDGVHVTGIFDNGIEAVEHCITQAPDIVLMDVQMPGMDGIEACRLIKLKIPTVKVLILTFYQIKENEISAVKYGCDGYVYKGHKSEDIISIIKSTYNGFSTFENTVRNTIHSEISSSSSKHSTTTELSKLTEREADIVRLITAGRRDAEIAKELFISEGHVRNQLMMIREKLGVRNSKELAQWGAKAGL